MNIFKKEFWAIFKETLYLKINYSMFFNIILSLVLLILIKTETEFSSNYALYLFFGFHFYLIIDCLFTSNKITTFYFIHKKFIEEHGEEFVKAIEEMNKQFEKEEKND